MCFTAECVVVVVVGRLSCFTDTRSHTRTHTHTHTEQQVREGVCECLNTDLIEPLMLSFKPPGWRDFEHAQNNSV